MRFPTFAAAAPSANQPDIRLVTFSLRGNEKHAAPHVPGMYAVARSAFLCSLIQDLPERLRDSKLHAACRVFHSLLVHESLGIPAHDHANTGIFRTSFRQRIRRSRSPQRLLYRQLCITPFPTPSLFLLLCSGQGPIQEPLKVEGTYAEFEGGRDLGQRLTWPLQSRI